MHSRSQNALPNDDHSPAGAQCSRGRYRFHAAGDPCRPERVRPISKTRQPPQACSTLDSPADTPTRRGWRLPRARDVALRLRELQCGSTAAAVGERRITSGTSFAVRRAHAGAVWFFYALGVIVIGVVAILISTHAGPLRRGLERKQRTGLLITLPRPTVWPRRASSRCQRALCAGVAATAGERTWRVAPDRP